MTVSAFVAIVVSATVIAILGLGDPKRRRAAGAESGALGDSFRRSLAATACLPGLVLAVTGDTSAFLIWFGGCGVIGWMLALMLATRQDKRG